MKRKEEERDGRKAGRLKNYNQTGDKKERARKKKVKKKEKKNLIEEYLVWREE